jgi:hypothetical protein
MIVDITLGCHAHRTHLVRDARNNYMILDNIYSASETVYKRCPCSPVNMPFDGTPVDRNIDSDHLEFCRQHHNKHHFMINNHRQLYCWLDFCLVLASPCLYISNVLPSIAFSDLVFWDRMLTESFVDEWHCAFASNSLGAIVTGLVFESWTLIHEDVLDLSHTPPDINKTLLKRILEGWPLRPKTPERRNYIVNVWVCIVPWLPKRIASRGPLTPLFLLGSANSASETTMFGYTPPLGRCQGWVLGARKLYTHTYKRT